MERRGKLALFGHQAVGRGRHVRGILAASLAGSGSTATISVAAASLFMERTGQAAGGASFAIAALVGIATLLIVLFLFYAAALGLAFTAARAVLSRGGRNFGAFYLALAMLLGTIEAVWTSSFRGGMTARELVFGIVTWLLMALVYWMVAAERTAGARAQRRTAEAFR